MTESDSTSQPYPANPVFIIRLWWEPDTDSNHETGEWRGSVELLNSGHRHFFRRLADVETIITAQMKDIPTPPLEEVKH